MRIYKPNVDSIKNLREPPKPIDPEQDDFILQVLDANITFTGDDIDEKSGVRPSIAYIHGVTENANTGLIAYNGYIPYFYLSVPEGGDPGQDYRKVQYL
jgi:hypothetical protein